MSFLEGENLTLGVPAAGNYSVLVISGIT
jgi:hypothetical protein